jgi:hypothetical protein
MRLSKKHPGVAKFYYTCSKSTRSLRPTSHNNADALNGSQCKGSLDIKVDIPARKIFIRYKHSIQHVQSIDELEREVRAEWTSGVEDIKNVVPRIRELRSRRLINCARDQHQTLLLNFNLHSSDDIRPHSENLNVDNSLYKGVQITNFDFFINEPGVYAEYNDNNQPSIDIFECCKEGDINALVWHLNHGYNINERIVSLFGRSLLHLAVCSQHAVEVTRILLEKGADVNAVDDKWKTALHMAADNQNGVSTEVIKFLVENGADVNVTDDQNRTALHFAVKNKKGASVEVIRFLLENGANI